MVTQTVTSTLCDKCGQEIAVNEQYLSAGAYGVDFHMACLLLMSVREFIVIMGLDDIYVSKMGDPDRGMKANSYFRQRIKADENDAYTRL